MKLQSVTTILSFHFYSVNIKHAVIRKQQNKNDNTTTTTTTNNANNHHHGATIFPLVLTFSHMDLNSLVGLSKRASGVSYSATFPWSSTNTLS